MWTTGGENVSLPRNPSLGAERSTIDEEVVHTEGRSIVCAGEPFMRPPEPVPG